MRVIVFGATGVLGRELVPLLVRQGYSVRAPVRSPERAQSLLGAGVEVCPGDLLAQETRDRLPALMAGCQAVVHIATAIPRDFGAPGAWADNTRLRTEGTRALLDAALAVGVERYIQQSIVMAYVDGGDRLLGEDTPLDASPSRAEICGPVIAMEGMVRGVPTDKMRWCILRGGSFVGPGTAQDDTIRRLREGAERVPCDGSNYISPVNVSDMAEAIAAALQRAPGGSIFNIVDEPLRQGDYLDRLADLSGAPSPLRDPSRPCPPSFRCSNAAAQAVLGWTPSHGIWPEPSSAGPG
ncbi:MAG TPA: NAD(P)-dependent oxidoreductase [Chloroflexia bacterium]|nr:NAD(P)-dependent oxidoreductase [Chloroflexia bacterium]